MPKKRLKPFTLPGHREASRLAARAEDVIKAGSIDHHRLEALTREVTFHQAGSKEAALFQFAALRDVSENISRETFADAGLRNNPNVDWMIEAQLRLIESLTTYVEEITGVSREQTSMSYFIGPRSPSPVDGSPSPRKSTRRSVMNGVMATVRPNPKSVAIT